MMESFIFNHGVNSWNYLPIEGVKAHLSEIAQQSVQAYIAEINNECVGFASFIQGLPPACQKYQADPINEIAYLSEIVVHREHAGKGIGSKLVHILKDYLIANKITKLYAERHADNINSAALMRKTGFEIVDEYLDEQRRTSGTKRTTVTMLKLT